MDLRPYIKSSTQVDKAVRLINKGDLFYQPFIIQDDLEVGEGQNLADRYAHAVKVSDYNVYAPNQNVGARKQPDDPAFFRKCNKEYRQVYNHYADAICGQLGNDISKLTFAEIGCNTGLNLFNLAVRGAKQCFGYDWNDMSEVFAWLNDLLKVNVKFQKGIYNNLYHQFKGFDVPEADVMINTVFTNHQCDPLQFLSYICDRARKGVFLVALTKKDSDAIHYDLGDPHKIFNTGSKFPLNFNNGVQIGEKLLLSAFARLGFGDVRVIDKFVPADNWDHFQSAFILYYALRTSGVKSAYSENRMEPKAATGKMKKTIDRMLGRAA